jgi:uncharacterized protein
MRTIEGEPLPPPHRAAAVRGMDPGTGLIVGIVFVLFLGGILRSLLGRLLGSAAAGGATGLLVWFLSGVVFYGLAASFIAFWVSILGAVSGGSRYRGLRSWGGGFGGGGFGGGGFGGGGFSGGGGSSGGGGASGSW